MLEHEETMWYIRQAQEGDEQAKVILLENNKPLLKSVIRRYAGKNVEYDDLYQIACIGFLKAIQNFSLDYNVRFSTYAVPMIVGEVKRFMRDDGYVKVSRSMKTLAYKINAFVERYKEQNAKDPTVEEIAAYFQTDVQEIVFAMDASKMPISLFETAEDDEKSQCLMDKLSDTEDNERLIDRVVLKNILSKLSPRERKIIFLRYFRDKTQSEIAEHLGVSQVQVSRLENKIIQKIRNDFLGE